MRPVQRLACLLLPAAFLAAQDPGFNGSWKYASDSGIQAAIDDTVKDMNFIKRPVARGRLKDGNPAYKTIKITSSAQEIVVQLDTRAPIKMPTDGKAVAWTREDGQKFMISAKIEGNKLVQTFKNEEVDRTNTYTLAADRKLTLSVHLKSTKLPKPLTYSIQFTGA